MRILLINRWDDEFADYGRYIDHHEHPTSYVTIPAHAPLIPAGARHVELVADMNDAEEVVAAAGRCQHAAGAFERVLGLSEFDLLTAARVRETYEVPGRDTDATLNFRDKQRMKEVLSATGALVPRYRSVQSVAEVAAFAAELGRDVIVKPRRGAASVGCMLLPAGADVYAMLAGVDVGDYEAEEFLHGPVWHVDGLIQRDEILCSRASRYINTCYDFMRGRPLGSVVHSGGEAEEITTFAERCLRHLGLRNSAFHLEVIQTSAGPAFLEVGARVGGGEIPFVFRDVYGIDLVGDWIRMELGQQPRTVPGRNHAEHAGFLMIPEAVGQRVVSRVSMLGTTRELYAEVLPTVGHVFDGHGGYDTLLGRFRYRGSTAEAIENAIRLTRDRYVYELEPAASGEGPASDG